MSEAELETEEFEATDSAVETVDEQPEAPSLREIISKSYDELATSPEENTSISKSDRDEKGRFLSKSGDKQVSDQVGEQGEETPQTESIKPPVSWSNEEKERFKTLPLETQKYIAQRESERDSFVTQKANKIAQDERKYAEINEAIAPHEQQWALQGVSPGQGIKQLIAAQAFLEKNPVAGLQWLAQSLGVDPRTLAQTAPQVDPQIQGIYGKVSQLEAQLAERDRQMQQAQMSSIQRELESFAKEVDERGSPKRPHFETIAEDMVPLVTRLRAENPSWSPREVLTEAYEKASWANPNTRKTILEEMERKRLEDGKSKVQSAKRAGVSLNGAPNGSTMRPAPKTLRDAIEASYDLLSSK